MGKAQQPERTESTLQCKRRDVLSGLLSGITTSIALQPMDKALYLLSENWKRPYHAMAQTVFYRAASNALYFPLEQWTREHFNNNMIGGIVSGALTSSLLNPINVIRMQCWSNHSTLKQEMTLLWRGRGMANFSKGLSATVIRDVIFGGVYSFQRHHNLFGYLDHSRSHYNYTHEFIWNGVSALVATTISSPFNYCRNIQFSAPHGEQSKSIAAICKELMSGYRQIRGIKAKFDFVQIRFKFGWGTLRVGLGMAMGSQAYEYFARNIPPF